MTESDSTPTVVTRSNQGQWENHVEERPDLSRSFSSRAAAIEMGAVLAGELGFRHVIEPTEPTGAITDQDSNTVDPATTDENGMPLDNPSG